MNTIIEGDILSIERGIICHQVNCQLVAGAGLALQIRNKWPDWFSDYYNSAAFLGAVGLFKAKSEIWIASLYAQDKYGSRQRHTDYRALRHCLQGVRQMAYDRLGGILPVYLPYGIGCGLAGGDWSIVSAIIEEELPQATLVKFTRPNNAMQPNLLRDATQIG